jgi:hypothetical protein
MMVVQRSRSVEWRRVCDPRAKLVPDRFVGNLRIRANRLKRLKRQMLRMRATATSRMLHRRRSYLNYSGTSAPLPLPSGP